MEGKLVRAGQSVEQAKEQLVSDAGAQKAFLQILCKCKKYLPCNADCFFEEVKITCLIFVLPGFDAFMTI